MWRGFSKARIRRLRRRPQHGGTLESGGASDRMPQRDLRTVSPDGRRDLESRGPVTPTASSGAGHFAAAILGDRLPERDRRLWNAVWGKADRCVMRRDTELGVRPRQGVDRRFGKSRERHSGSTQGGPCHARTATSGGHRSLHDQHGQARPLYSSAADVAGATRAATARL